MTQEEAKAAAEAAIRSAQASLKAVQGTDWDESYGGLASVAAAREAQTAALEAHEALMSTLGEAFTAAQRALSKKFEKLEAVAVEAQQARMFSLQRTAGALQRKEYEASMYDIAPRQAPAPAPAPAAASQDDGFSFA